MIEIYLLMVVLVTIGAATRGAPKRRSYRRSRRKWVNWTVVSAITLSTLADATAIEGVVLDNTDDLFLYSALCTWNLRNATAGEGPIEVVLADSAYSVGQIIEALDASPVSKSDKINLERTKRHVRLVGALPGITTEEVLNNGNPVYTRCMFPVSATSAVSAFAINRSGAQLAGGTVVRVTGRLVGYWT